MRRKKTVARVLLIFFIANVVLAAPAVVRQRSLVTDVPDDESTDESMPSLMTASDVSETSPPPSQAGSLHESPPGSEKDWTPGSPVGSLHQDGAEPAAPAGLHQDWIASHASLSDVSLSQDLESPHDSDSALVPEAPQLHYVSPSYFSSPTSGTPPSQDDPRPGSGSPPLHNDDSLAGPGAQPGIWKDVPLRSGAQPSYQTLPPASEAAPLHDEPLPGPGAAPLHNNPLSGSGAQPLHEDLHPSWQNYRPVTEIEQVPSSRLQSSHLQPGALEAPRVSGASLGFEWEEAFNAAAEAEAKEAEDKVKPPKGLCGLRCWMQFYF